MGTINQDSQEVPGTELDVEKVDFEKIEKWLSRDVKACLAFLNAIDQDVDLRRQMAVWFHGRVKNFKNKPDVSQSDLFPKR